MLDGSIQICLWLAAHAIAGRRRQRATCHSARQGLADRGLRNGPPGYPAEARAALLTTSYAALILDLGLPDGDGLAILRELRQRKDPLPVLVLPARGGLQDRVGGLRSGADDYLVKPFALEELIARLEAQLRRPGQQLGNSIRIANLEFDLRNRQAFIDDRPQVLSSRETAVLELLMRSKGRVAYSSLRQPPNRNTRRRLRFGPACD
jgi:DNA-binding response OmpR family regulator